MREYGQRKHNLLVILFFVYLFFFLKEELKNLKLFNQSIDNSTLECSMVPLNTNLECNLSLNVERGLCLRLSVTNNVPIKAVLLFAEGIFDSECYSMFFFLVFFIIIIIF